MDIGFCHIIPPGDLPDIVLEVSVVQSQQRVMLILGTRLWLLFSDSRLQMNEVKYVWCSLCE